MTYRVISRHILFNARPPGEFILMFIPTHEIPKGIFFIIVLFFPVQFFIKMVECGGNIPEIQDFFYINSCQALSGEVYPTFALGVYIF